MAETMKAQVFYEKEKMGLEEMKVPEVGPTDVLLRSKTVGVCGSDVSYYYGWSPLDTASGKGPLVLGHEFTGEVVEVGAVPKQLGLYKPGDRVVVNPVQSCQACYACHSGNTHMCQNLSVLGVSVDGAFAEYVSSNYMHLFKLPDNVSFEAGAIVEPMACAVNGFNKLDIVPGQFVAIFGPGPIGLMMVQLARAFGAGKVALIGTRDYRLELGKKVGADFIFNTKDSSSPYYAKDLSEAIADVTHGRMAERVIAPTGSNEAFELGVAIGGPGSIAVHFGLPDGDAQFKIPALEWHQADKQIRAAWLAPMVWPQTIRLIEEGMVDLNALVTHAYDLEQTAEAIQVAKEKTGDPVKVEVKVS